MPYVNIKITREGATAAQKAEVIKGVTELLQRVLNKNPPRHSWSLTRWRWKTGASAGFPSMNTGSAIRDKVCAQSEKR